MNLLYKELTKDLNQSAYMLSKAALAIPTDKLDWTPGGKTRSTIDILKECAWFPAWLTYAVENKKAPSDVETKSIVENALKEGTTCESLCEIIQNETKKFCEFILKYPEENLTQEISFPWGTYTIAGVFGFHYWNNTYHLGQLNYVQLIFGDTEMHT